MQVRSDDDGEGGAPPVMVVRQTQLFEAVPVVVIGSFGFVSFDLCCMVEARRFVVVAVELFVTYKIFSRMIRIWPYDSTACKTA